MKKQLIEMYGNQCFYCDVPLTPDTFTKDHVVPRSKGGSNDISNLVPACKSCNFKKGSLLLTREQVRELKWTFKEVKVAVKNKEKTIKTARKVVRRMFSEGWNRRAEIKRKRLEINNEVAQKLLKSLKGNN